MKQPCQQEGVKLTNGVRPSARRRGSSSRTIKRLSGLVVLGVGVLMTSGCSAEEALRFGWPEGVTPEGQEMRTFWTWSVIAALAMGVLVWGLIFWTITFHRRKKNTVRKTRFRVRPGTTCRWNSPTLRFRSS